MAPKRATTAKPKPTPQPKPLPAPISYRGSKARDIPQITQYLPAEFDKTCDKFIDVFGGGGSVFLHYLQQQPDLPTVYNDIDPTLCDLFNILKSKERTAELNEWLAVQNYDLDEWKRRSEAYRANPADIRERLYLKALAFRGDESSKCPNMRKVDGELILDKRATIKFPDYSPILARDNFTVTQMPALDVIAKYADDEHAFLYLDPPYLATDIATYTQTNAKDIHKLFDIMHDPAIKCKLMLHIEFIGYTFAGLHKVMKHYYPRRYSMSSTKVGAELYSPYIMIATNYPAPHE